MVNVCLTIVPSSALPKSYRASEDTALGACPGGAPLPLGISGFMLLSCANAGAHAINPITITRNASFVIFKLIMRLADEAVAPRTDTLSIISRSVAVKRLCLPADDSRPRDGPAHSGLESRSRIRRG